MSDVREDLRSLGLLLECQADITLYDSEGSYLAECTAPVLTPGSRCAKHNGTIEMKAELNLVKTRMALAEKQRLEDEILPKATARVMAILADSEAKHADLIKIWMTTMDRIGLAAVSGLIVEDVTQRTAPMDMLKELLNKQPDMLASMAGIVDSTLEDSADDADPEDD